MSEDNGGSKVSVFLVGLGIGALVGLLFAPKSGEDTREYLSGKADEGRDYAQRTSRTRRRPARTQQGNHGSPEGCDFHRGGSRQGYIQTRIARVVIVRVRASAPKHRT